MQSEHREEGKRPMDSFDMMASNHRSPGNVGAVALVNLATAEIHSSRSGTSR